MIKKNIVLILFAVFCWSGGTVTLLAETEKQKEQQQRLPLVRLSPDIKQLLKAEQWEPAVEKLTEAYEKISSDPNLKYYVTYCLEVLAAKAEKEKRFGDGIDYLENAVQYVNGQPRLYIGLGFCYFSLSQYDEAEGAYSRALHIASENFLANRMLSEICYLTNRLNEAQEYWLTALKTEPDNKYVNWRLEGLKKANRLSGDLETEEDMMFSVSFNGSRKPRLRELVLNMLMEISHSQLTSVYDTKSL